MDLITEEDSRTRKTFFDIHEVRWSEDMRILPFQILIFSPKMC